MVIAILLQYEKEDFGETDGDQDGGIRGNREGCDTACHLCKDTGSEALDWQEGESCKA